MSDEPSENDPAWMEACRREEAIRDLLRRYPRRMTKRAVEDVAWELGLSRTTLHLLIGRYRVARTVEVLLDQPVGRPKGRLHEEPVRQTDTVGPERDHAVARVHCQP
jgi:putative transposase